MIIKKLKIKNIRSYRDLEIDFPIGTTLLSGDIGSGKTSILLALQFALFGLQPGQKGASIIRQGEEFASVSLDIEIDDGIFGIERGLRRSKNGSITQEDAVLKIGEETYELSTSELKNKVISLLGYPMEFAKKSDLLYKFTVYSPQEEMKEIINERAEIRLDIIRHIFGVDKYRRIKDNAQILLQEIKDSIKAKEFEIKEINSLREKLSISNENKIRVTKNIQDYLVILNKLISDKSIAILSMDKYRKDIEEKNKSDIEKAKIESELIGKKNLKSRIEKDISSNKIQISNPVEFSQESLDSVYKFLAEHKAIVSDLNQKLLVLNSKIYALNSKKENSFKIKNDIISMDNCPTCYQNVGDEYKDRMSKKAQYEIEDIQREVEQKLIDKNQLTKDIDYELELIKKYEQDKAIFERNKIKFEHQKIIDTKIKSDGIILERIISEISILEKNVEKICLDLKKYDDLRDLYDKEKARFDDVDSRCRSAEVKIAEMKKEEELVGKRIEEIVLEIAGKERIREKSNRLRSLQDWISNHFISMINIAEVNVMTNLRREFSKIFDRWFSILVSDSLSAKISEDFSPIIFNKDYEISYDFLSGGERTAVALAYRLALNKIIKSIMSKVKTKDLLVLDEPTDGFSSEQLGKMREIFNELDIEQVILVSHEQKIEELVDNVIRVKKDGVSSIENIKG